MVEIRRCTLAEIPEMVAIETDVQPNGWSAKQFADSIESDHLVWVATASHEVVGFLVITCAAGSAEILNVAVNAHHQKRGIGQQLIDFAIEQSRLHGAEALLLEVRQSNLAAISLYEKNNFALVGKRKNYYRTAASTVATLDRQAREHALLYQLLIET